MPRMRRPDEAKWALDFYQRRRKYEVDRDLLERARVAALDLLITQGGDVR